MTKAWHFINGNKLRDGQVAEVGKTYEVTTPLEFCENGLHASIKATDAIQYAPGNTLCLVECSGKIIKGKDKLVCSRRKIIAMADAESTLLRFSADCALTACMIADNWDQRSLDAIEMVYLIAGGNKVQGDVKKKIVNAAASAAISTVYHAVSTVYHAAASAAYHAAASTTYYAAASTTYYAAASAAASAAYYAAASTTYYAAASTVSTVYHAAASAAYHAAASAAKQDMNKILEEYLNKLF